MTTATGLKQKTKHQDFEKSYDKIMKKATEFNKLNCPSYPLTFNTQEVFKKFSLYTDNPNSITSFNTDATL